MSDDEADPELLELLRQKLGLGQPTVPLPPETRVLESAEYIYDNSIDVALNRESTELAAELVWRGMQEKGYSAKTWKLQELHPNTRDEKTIDFILTMDLLNFSFWSDKSADERFAIEYRGKRWTGYSSLVAALQRALDEGIPITDSDFWQNEEECTEKVFRHVFRSATDEEIPLLKERLSILREAGRVLYEKFDCSFVNCIKEADASAAALVNIVAEEFSCFRDEFEFEGRMVRLLKRAQILVADIWACFEGEGFGRFDDIDKITMFADYRVPQILCTLGCMQYSPPLESLIRRHEVIESGSTRELEIRGCTIWCVELMKRIIQRRHPEQTNVNAVLIDFYLYDTMKEYEAKGMETIPHHRTRSIWY